MVWGSGLKGCDSIAQASGLGDWYDTNKSLVA
jgi:hypothetical protein